MRGELKKYIESDFMASKAENTRQLYREIIERLIQFTKKPIRDTNIADIQAFIKDTRINLSPRTVNIYIAGIRCFYLFMKREHRKLKWMRLYDYICEIPKSKIVKKLPELISIEQVQEMIELSKGNPRHYLLMSILANTGWRRGDIAALKKKDFHGDYFEITLEKTKEVNILPVPKKLKEIILDQLEKSNGSEYFFPAHAKGQKTEHITERGIWKIVKVYGDKLNLKVHPHMIRHTLGTEIYRRTHDLYQVKEFLGHKSIETTKIYIDLAKEEKLEMKRKIGIDF